MEVSEGFVSEELHSLDGTARARVEEERDRVTWGVQLSLKTYSIRR